MRPLLIVLALVWVLPLDASAQLIQACVRSNGGLRIVAGPADCRGEETPISQIRSRRTRQGKVRWYVDLRPYGRIFSVPGFGPLVERDDAARVLSHIQGEF
jgi:hypothetical protein